MKTIVLIMLMMIPAITFAQANKTPVRVEDAPTIFNRHFDPYLDYTDQGSAMYINNSHFQNKDNIITNSFPATNGQYITPGNSNPIYRNMNDGSQTPSGIIYSGYIPVYHYGNSGSRQEGDKR